MEVNGNVIYIVLHFTEYILEIPTACHYISYHTKIVGEFKKGECIKRSCFNENKL